MEFIVADLLSSQELGKALSFLIRIVVAALLGLVIGAERTKRQKDAGTRTHCIIAVAAASFMIISKYGFTDIEAMVGESGADPARIAAQIVSGISFLGAGVIFKDRNDTIKGLTTAAGIWATAAVGMAAGAGMYWLCIIETAVIILSQILLHRFPMGNNTYAIQEIIITLTNMPRVQDLMTLLIRQHEGCVEKRTISRDGDTVTMKLSIRVHQPITFEESIAYLTKYPDIIQIVL